MNDNDKKFDGMSFSTSWVQPMNTGWGAFSGMTSGEVYNALTTDEELARLDFLETQLEAMSYYPDVERLLANILK
mgnify:FL=1|jgi:hypothetical protein